MSAETEELKHKMRHALRGERVEKLKRPGPSFHRPGTVNFNPYQYDFYGDNFLEKYLLKGWTPAAPPISRGTKVTAFGSCFAANITKHLSKIGYNTSKDRDPDIYVSHLADGLVNVHALSGQFEWAFENMKPPEGLWHGYDATEYGIDEDMRLRTRAIFLDTDFFIVTLGLSEIWYDEQTGGVFWRAVPARKFDTGRHKFRVEDFAESKAKIALMYRLIRQHVPNAKVLFTLSPISLGATFRPVSCITANSVSKAILRAALDEFYRENEADLNTRLFYFPSYEFVNECFPLRYRHDNRHPHDAIIETIMRSFEAVYCETDFSLADAEAMFRDVRAFSLKALGEVMIREEQAAAQEALPEPAPQLSKPAPQLAKPAPQLAKPAPQLSKPAKLPNPAKRPTPQPVVKRSFLRRALSAAKRRLTSRPK